MVSETLSESEKVVENVKKLLFDGRMKVIFWTHFVCSSVYQPREVLKICVVEILKYLFIYQPYSDHGVQAAYHQVYAQSAIAMPAPMMQPETVKVRSVIFFF